MKTTVTLIILAFFIVFTSCKEKVKPLPVPEEKTIVKDTVQPLQISKEPKKPATIENQKYFLIAGCFEYEDLAHKLCEKLKQEGHDSRIVPYYENLYLVSFCGFPTLAEAKTALTKLKQEPGKEKTWLYRSKY